MTLPIKRIEISLLVLFVLNPFIALGLFLTDSALLDWYVNYIGYNLNYIIGGLLIILTTVRLFKKAKRKDKNNQQIKN